MVEPENIGFSLPLLEWMLNIEQVGPTSNKNLIWDTMLKIW